MQHPPSPGRHQQGGRAKAWGRVHQLESVQGGGLIPKGTKSFAKRNERALRTQEPLCSVVEGEQLANAEDSGLVRSPLEQIRGTDTPPGKPVPRKAAEPG